MSFKKHFETKIVRWLIILIIFHGKFYYVGNHFVRVDVNFIQMVKISFWNGILHFHFQHVRRL